MDTWLIVVLVIGGLFSLIVLAVMGRFLGLWIQSVVSARRGHPRSVHDAARGRPAAIVLNRPRRRRVSNCPRRIGSLYLAGGDIERVVRAMIAADKAQIELPWDARPPSISRAETSSRPFVRPPSTPR